MPKFKLLGIFIFIVTVLVGCIKSRATFEGKGCEDASFIVDEVTGTLVISDETALPEKFTLDLRARIRSRGKIETTLPNTHWAVSNDKKTLNEKTKDIAKSTNLDNKTNKVIQMTTDGTGTIEWTQEHDYAYSSKSTWIVLDLYIKGLSNEHPGLCKIPLAVNPWLQLDNYADIQVADYREQYNKKNNRLKNRVELKGQQFLNKKKREEEDKGVDLIVKELKLHRESQKSTADKESGKRITSFSNNTISAKLQYSIRDIKGNILENKNTIKQGEFVMESHLLMQVSCSKGEEQEKGCTEKKKKYAKINREHITGSAVETQFHFQENDFFLTSKPFDWRVPLISFSEGTTFYLYVKITPKQPEGKENAKRINAKRLNNFEGLYHLGDNFSKAFADTKKDLTLHPRLQEKHDDKIKHKASRVEEQANSYDLYDLDGCLKNLNYGRDSVMKQCVSKVEVNTSMEGVTHFAWSVDQLNIRFFNMEKENWLERTISTNIYTKVLNTNKKAEGNIPIEVTVTDFSTGKQDITTKETDSNGSLAFTINTRQKWYKKQRFFLKHIKFETTQSNNLEAEKIIAINPWDYGFTHGYEVHNSDSIRTTCLKKDNKEQVLNGTENLQSSEKVSAERLMSRLIYSSPQKQDFISSFSDKDLDEVLSDFFCYDRTDALTHGNKETQEGYSKRQKYINILNLGIFHNSFKTIFQELTNYDFTRIKKIFNTEEKEEKDEKDFEEFTSKFKSITEVPSPQSYVHLFRGINKYPYYLIDDSLSRSIYYDMRFKLSPRVVRYDDIARGQQNKGPLRDGVYVLQMALLKNDQGRLYGANNMVQREKPDFSLSPVTSIAGTVPLYTCPLNKPKCITKEDFIIPPTNLPVVVFDGMIKEDIKLPIKRKHLLFANSKNFLVFRILPANPDSVECKDETSDCVKPLKGVWHKNINMEKTKKTIELADPKSYDMFFHTYRVPFIPSAWSNWAITKEMSDNFDQIEKKYEELLAARLAHQSMEDVTDEQNVVLLQGANKKRANIDCINKKGFDKNQQIEGDKSVQQEEAKRRATEETIKQHIDEELESERRKREQEWKSKDNAINQQIKNRANDRNYNCEDADSNDDLPVISTGSSDEPTKDLCKDYRIKTLCEDKSLKEAEKLDRISKISGGDAKENTYASFCNKSNFYDLLQLSETAIKECKRRDFSAEIKEEQQVEQVEAKVNNLDDFPKNEDSCMKTVDASDFKSKPCSKTPKTRKDRLNRHIEYFSSENSLCVLDMDSENVSAPGHYCGGDVDVDIDGKLVATPVVSSESFLEHINTQRQILNNLTKKNELKLSSSSSKLKAFNGPLNEESKSSMDFSKTLQKISGLDSNVTQDDLKRIIRRDNIMKGGNNDPKTSAFLHSLCGFWFENFLSQKYINPQLISASFRNAVKNTVYYKIRGVDPVSEENEQNCNNWGSNSIDPENMTDIDTNCFLYKMKEQYEQSFSDRVSFGYIDNLHKWTGDKWTETERENNKHFEYEKYISHRLAEKASKPALDKDVGPVSFGDKNSVNSVNSVVESYLNETSKAVENLKRNHKPWVWSKDLRKKSEDYHPVRKCLLNPSHFFGFEKKIIVGKIDGIGSEYDGGESLTLDIREDFLMNTQRDTGANQQFGTALDTNFLELLTLPLLAIGGLGFLGIKAVGLSAKFVNGITEPLRNKLRRQAGTPGSRLREMIGHSMGTRTLPMAVLSVLGLTAISAKADYSYRAYEGVGRRKLRSIRVSEGVELKVDHKKINIALANHRECLVIRPRLSAFQSPPEEGDRYKHIWHDKNKTAISMYEKMGLLLCAKSDRSHIIEDYYYIYSNLPINSIATDPSSHRNKPFTVSIRGQKEYQKFKNSLNCYVAKTTVEAEDKRNCRDFRGEYEYLGGKYLEFAKNLRKGFNIPKMFHQTLDSPGVHSIYKVEDRDHRDTSNNGAFEDLFYKFMRLGGSHFSADLEQYLKKDPDQQRE